MKGASAANPAASAAAVMLRDAARKDPLTRHTDWAPPAGFEPATYGVEIRCAIRCATGASDHITRPRNYTPPNCRKPMDRSLNTLESMARHHTKDKGDLGIAKAHADLVSKGFTVLFPATEHAPFDLVAYAAGEFHRVQVKYRSARAGAVSVTFRSMWADRRGTHTTQMDKSAIDTVCIYCPETDECYYVRPAAHGASVTLRVSPSRNGQQAGVLHAASYRGLPRLTRSLTAD